jgi:ribosomal protein L40E
MSNALLCFLREQCVLVTLYVLAAPVYFVRFVFRAVKAVAVTRVLRTGAVSCPHCGASNPIDVLATCRRCGHTEFGSRLYCSNCRQVTPAFPCALCQAMIRLL